MSRNKQERKFSHNLEQPSGGLKGRLAGKKEFIPDESMPIEALRVIQSYDPCLACAVH
ncbi:MAG: nickel-dependent hydrogenase large subunit [Chloroflexota bacterium]